MGDASRVDLFALNSYSWCGNATYTSSGYDVLTESFKDSSVPVFLSEYGCNEVVGARPWSEIPSLYGDEMAATMSGGVVYEWTQEANNYGLVELESSGDMVLMENFQNLQNQLAALDIASLQSSPGRNKAVNPPDCTADLIQNSTFPTNFTLPATPSGAASLIEDGLTGANQGKLITITNLTPSQKVEDHTGAAVSAKIVPVADGEVNTATRTGNGGPSAGSATTSGSASASSSKAAGVENMVVGKGAVVLGALGLLLSL